MRFLRTFRPNLVSGLLVLALVLVVAVAYEAVHASRSQRATAESALREFAGLAALEFRRAAEREVAGSVRSTLRPLFGSHHEHASPRMPTADGLAALEAASHADPAECGCAPPLRVTGAYFRADPATGEIRSSRADGASPNWDWVREAVSTRPDGEPPDVWRGRSAFRRADGSTRAIFYAYAPEQSGARFVAYGFETDLESFTPVFERVFADVTLLPIERARGSSNDSLLSLRVVGPEGRPFFASQAGREPRFASSQTLSGEFVPPFVVEAAVRPSAVRHLIIGGLPRSRMPLLLGILGVTAGLVGVAVVQLRREEALARARTDFVAGVSHELRTPLSQIRMFAEMLSLGRVRSEEEGRRWTAKIERAAGRLTYLIDNVLHLSRAERGLSRISVEPVSVTALLEDVREAFAPLAHSREVDLRVEGERDLVALVDRVAVQQVLLNLLENAAKYGPKGGTVTLGVGLREDRLQLWVEDEGDGIPVEHREAVWEKFHRLDGAREAGTGGTGIGLAVARDLVRRHRGSARVEDASGGGARFVVELPGAWRRPDRGDSGAGSVSTHAVTADRVEEDSA